MKHIPKEQMNLYILDQLTDENRKTMENHLYSCEACLDSYLQLMENSLVEDSVSDFFTEKTIARIQHDSKPSSKSSNASSLFSKSIIHYVLAAGLTLILMFSGVFDNMISLTDRAEVSPKQSLTEQLMKKTDQLLEEMKGDHN
ncbi:hypothetical protein [Gracilibacillus dipsosauri]|uniref:Zinc-finger domain-containing protein n=1 Tax=Gracilibacillus dipsosauri TaxID=178340 RepID=A0A317KY53_9BACI|nr:hypothetical protein [Gracilibacillus dipsosauri]PWU68451.1 hypothetical protein DLJ74_08375 [Gracilibacillus dipsosauri]